MRRFSLSSDLTKLFRSWRRRRHGGQQTAVDMSSQEGTGSPDKEPAQLLNFPFSSVDDDASTPPLQITFADVGFRIRGRATDILSGLHGSCEAGSILGVMGPSGSGKSSFVNLLSGRNEAITGEFYLNGYRMRSAELRSLIGFVPQDDLVLPELTVRENLLHSARVMLGGQLGDPALGEYVDSLIVALGLARVQDQMVGSVARRGLSGGECKRVSIGLELAAAPKVLILDEPTSGLDATAALSLMQLLREVSRCGIMVICVIHQPRAEIFALLDNLMLLNLGKQVYFGPAAEAQTYFEALGYGFSSFSNPADTIMDILPSHAWADTTPSLSAAKEAKSCTPVADTYNNTALDEAGDAPLQVPDILRSLQQRRASWSRQVWLCFRRGTVQQTRQTASFCLEIISASVIGVTIGLTIYEFHGHMFQGIYHPPFELLSSAVNYRMVAEQGLLACLAIACAAGPPGVKLLGEEKLIFRREQQTGHSRSAYFLGKNLSVLLRMFLASLHYTTFYMILSTPTISFGLQLAISFLYFYCMYGLGCIVAAITHREDGPLVCMLSCLVISALGGCAPRLALVKTWNLGWFWYMWPGTWLSEAFYNENTAPFAYLYQLDDASRFTGYKNGRTGFDIGLLLLIGTLYRVIAYPLFVAVGWR
ncbi:putative ABC transporter [Aspergillus saccharolyticus JOP 1030-1]|uniref:Putative ABC transporter n=1 Tax=Aspergillus saccharolyticus JOP 1030-1 TaxID=1450539 RepID=A0A318ZI79_9EURO|nr:putative ABC transporter [Aspergillus saccharolyticus JOP 1030-1]PYH46477.1 putative ABC transporter [Aspergillus saccharolyticus JOP 1030-1]